MKLLKIFLLTIPISILIYSLFFGPYQLESTYHEVTIGKNGKSLLVAHITDLHTKGFGKIEQKLLNTLQSEKPDIIFLTGDISTPGGTIEGYEEVLSKLKAPQGVYFVQGNWEYWEPISELGSILKRNGIVDLTNKSQKLNDDLWLVGLDDQLAGSPNLEVFNKVPKEARILSLFHSPISFENIKEESDLSFAGHSHGGQIRFPLIGALWTPEGTGKYDAGWFKEGRGKMYVSRGLGNSILPARFFCRPEVAYIRIKY
jgi:predicted MPP superfamily phosphohydrolase